MAIAKDMNNVVCRRIEWPFRCGWLRHQLGFYSNNFEAGSKARSNARILIDICEQCQSLNRLSLDNAIREVREKQITDSFPQRLQVVYAHCRRPYVSLQPTVTVPCLSYAYIFIASLDSVPRRCPQCTRRLCINFVYVLLRRGMQIRRCQRATYGN